MQRTDVQILDLKKAINNRDKIIQEKEKAMQILKGENQTLEKHKFVLEFNIEDLKEQVGCYLNLFIQCQLVSRELFSDGAENHIDIRATKSNPCIIDRKPWDYVRKRKNRYAHITKDNI